MDEKQTAVLTVNYEKKVAEEAAKDRPYNMSLEDHLNAWEQSGKVHLRNRSNYGYVMTRKNLSEPFSNDNYLITVRWRSQYLGMMPKGGKHTDEAKEKIRQARLGKKFSAASKAKMRVAKLGTKQSEETKRKISEGVKRSLAKKRGAA